MSELKWNWVYRPYLDAPEKQEESALRAGYAKVVFKSDADEVIARLEAEIARLKGMLNVWRKVSDELPKEYEDILFIDADRCYSLGHMWIIPHYGNGPDEQYWSGRGEPRTENVTHWMPLPPAPEEDK